MGLRAFALIVTLCACRFGFDARRAELGDGDVDGDRGDVGDAGDRPNRVFLTSTLHGADFGSIAAADTICQARADAAALAGTFIALVANQTRPELRLAGSRGWVDVAGLPIVDEPAMWLDGYMFHALQRDETGARQDYELAWVGSVNDCTGWTSTVAGSGSVVVSAEAWGAYTVESCAAMSRFVCAEVGHAAVVSPSMVSGRLQFLTSISWLPGGGRASADALCASEATANSLSGTYFALLSTSTEDAWVRFSTSGSTWTRIDGIALAPTAAAVAGPTPDYLASFSHVTSTGTRYPYATAWTGSASANCVDWTSASSTMTGRVGSSSTIRRDVWRGYGDGSCDVPRPVLCFQQ